MDREADCYALMAAMVDDKARFVVRMAGAKRPIVDDQVQNVSQKLAGATVLVCRKVPLTPRKPSPLPSRNKKYPARPAREAQLQISATRVTLRRPDSSSHSPHKTLTLNVVHVIEPNPPAGQEAVEWRLWTTEPVDSAQDVLAIVDAYRCRWTIEEYFKALKTGCAIESRQLETEHGLLNVLALYAPIAWRLLRLRTLSRDRSDAPATDVLTPIQLICLRGALAEKGRPKLPDAPTIRDALLGVAGLGGHIKNNGEPGWIVLGRGLDYVLTIEVGYRLAIAKM
jgi:hypothetical protein